jgi:acyl-homoserine lactone acylase PvdQ
MPPSRTPLLFLTIFLLLVAVVSFGFYRTITRPFPQTEDTITLEGLTAPVTIRRNADGVPAITATTREDLFFAQGFVHAQDRLFQMDVQRRQAQEITGGLHRTDFITRALDEVTTADPQIPVILDAYSRGVNAYVAAAPTLPLEYQWLGKAWEPWLPEDSLVIVELYAQAIRKADAYQRTWQRADSPTIMPIYIHIQSISFTSSAFLTPWYANRLESPDYRATGVSLMGVPFVVTGANGATAWAWQGVNPCPTISTSIAFFPPALQPYTTPLPNCGIDLVSWFTGVMGNTSPTLPVNPYAVSTRWLTTQTGGTFPPPLPDRIGQSRSSEIAMLAIHDEADVGAWVAALNAVPSNNIIVQRAQEQLAAWNGEMDPDLPGATLYRVVRYFTLREMVRDELGENLALAYLAETNGQFVEPLLDDPTHLLWDDTRTPETESRDGMIARAWEEAHDYLGRRFGDVPHEWAWGRLHSVTFRHPLATQFPLIDRLLTRTIPLAGDATTLIPVPDDPTRDFAPSAIPSLKIILSPGGDLYVAYPGGQSTHPFHPQSNTFLDAWATGDLIKLEWNGQNEAVLELVTNENSE